MEEQDVPAQKEKIRLLLTPQNRVVRCKVVKRLTAYKTYESAQMNTKAGDKKINDFYIQAC